MGLFPPTIITNPLWLVLLNERATHTNCGKPLKLCRTNHSREIAMGLRIDSGTVTIDRDITMGNLQLNTVRVEVQRSEVCGATGLKV